MEATIGYKLARVTTSKKLTADFLNTEVRLYGDLGDHADAQLKGERHFQLGGWYRDTRGLHLQLYGPGKANRVIFDVLDETKVGVAKFDNQEAAKAARTAK